MQSGKSITSLVKLAPIKKDRFPLAEISTFHVPHRSALKPADNPESGGSRQKFALTYKRGIIGMGNALLIREGYFNPVVRRVLVSFVFEP